MVVAEAVAVAVEVHDDGAVQESVEHGGGDGGVAEDLAPSIWNWHRFVLTKRCCWQAFCVDVGIRDCQSGTCDC